MLYFPGTVIARGLIFPLIVKGQREAAKIHNHMPVIQKFSNQIREAKLAGDQAACELAAGQCGREAVDVRHSAVGEGRVLQLGGSGKSKGVALPWKGHGPKMKLFTFIDVTLNPVTHFPPLAVYRATIEMSHYQKKHDIKLFRPLILPLTQVSLSILNPVSSVLLPMSQDAQKSRGR